MTAKNKTALPGLINTVVYSLETPNGTLLLDKPVYDSLQANVNYTHFRPTGKIEVAAGVMTISVRTDLNIAQF